MTQPTYETQELGRVVIKLRDDLRIGYREYGGQPCFLLEDPGRGRFFRLGLSEYTFVSLLDGQTTIADALGETATLRGADALTQSEAAAVCRWLIETGLATTPASLSEVRLSERPQPDAQARARRWLNPICIQMPVGNPQPLLEPLRAIGQWLFGLPGAVVWLLLVAAALFTCGPRWRELLSGPIPIHTSDQWIWLGVTWLCLKLVHECAHAVACMRYGGRVPQCGILWLLFVPLPYVDVTSAWGFRQRRQRLTVSAAGMLAELAIAALAALVWAHSHDLAIRQQAYLILLSASLTTLLFNANPLMRFDGYYLLTDLCELPNLATHGQQHVRALARRFLLGIKSPPLRLPEGHERWVLTYGLAAAAWKVVVCVSLVLAASRIAFGAGIALAVVAATHWVLIPAAKKLKWLATDPQIGRSNRLRFSALVATGAVAIFSACSFLTWTERFEVPVVVVHAEQTEIRSGSSGLIDQVWVDQGQWVHEGDRLLRLQNPELEALRDDLQLAIAQSRLRQRQFHQAGLQAACEVERKTAIGLRDRLDQLETRLQQLTVRAPHSGTILTSDPEALRGRYVGPGAKLLTVGDNRQIELRALVPQEASRDIEAVGSQSLTVHIWGDGLLNRSGHVLSVQPRATSEIEFTQLVAPNGGPVAVRARAVDQAETATPDAEEEGAPGWTLVEPHVIAHLSIDPSGLPLRAGQTGVARLVSNRRTLGQKLTAAWADWSATNRH